MAQVTHYDFVVVGSGFGGSVSALRLSEKGYNVLVLEKGRRLEAKDFPKSNWNLKKWLWMPLLNWRGLFKMTFFRHITIFSGVGVGGGSLVYANTLPIPKDGFFQNKSWAHLGNWKEELMPHYHMAKKMLGADQTKKTTFTDEIFKEMAAEIGRPEAFEKTDVAVFMGEPGKTVPDPYFGGKGPDRTGCNYCGGCMIGCRYGAKNTLDKNYLYLAENLGCTIQPDSEVKAIQPDPQGGYHLIIHRSKGWFRKEVQKISADKVVLSGGVLGTVPLLLDLKDREDCLPNLSEKLGKFVRTNSEAIFGVVAPDSKENFSEGVAISSIIHTDEHSHLEPVRYSKDSGFFRLLMFPHAPGETLSARLIAGFKSLMENPLTWLKTLFVRQFANKSQILLYMRSLEGSIAISRTHPLLRMIGVKSKTTLDRGEAPSAFLKEATELANRFAKKVNGVVGNLFLETLLAIPSTAHILGGCCMGSNKEEGVIDADHEVFDYPGLYVVDGSAVSANPGVNPSLTITALAERAMSKIPPNED